MFVLIVNIHGNETCAPSKLVCKFADQLAEISRELEQSLSTSIFSKSSGTAQSSESLESNVFVFSREKKLVGESETAFGFATDM